MTFLRVLFVLVASLGTASADRALKIPPRVQQGGTCGLYALGMIMDYHHLNDAKNPTALVRTSDYWRRASHTLSPTIPTKLFDLAKTRGYTKTGGMFYADKLAALANEVGYRTRLVDVAEMPDIKSAIDRGNPVLMAFDVSPAGDPARLHGTTAHWAVISGYFSEGGVDYLHAIHGWDGKERVWRANELLISSQQLKNPLPGTIDSPDDMSKTLGGRMIEVLAN